MAKLRTSGYAARRFSFVTAFIGYCNYEAISANGNLQTAFFPLFAVHPQGVLPKRTDPKTERGLSQAATGRDTKEQESSMPPPPAPAAG
jgi:hypothetical protein